MVVDSIFIHFGVTNTFSDSESVWTRIMEVLLEPYGVQFNWDIKLKMMGKKEHEAGKMLISMMRYYFLCRSQGLTVLSATF